MYRTFVVCSPPKGGPVSGVARVYRLLYDDNKTRDVLTRRPELCAHCCSENTYDPYPFSHIPFAITNMALPDHDCFGCFFFFWWIITRKNIPRPLRRPSFLCLLHARLMGSLYYYVCVCVCLCVLLSRRRACDPFSLDITRADVYTQGCGVHNVRRYGVSFLFPPVDLSVVIRLGKVEYDRIFRTFSSGRSSVCMTETVYGRVLVTNAPCQWSATTLWTWAFYRFRRARTQLDEPVRLFSTFSSHLLARTRINSLNVHNRHDRRRQCVNTI